MLESTHKKSLLAEICTVLDDKLPSSIFVCCPKCGCEFEEDDFQGSISIIAKAILDIFISRLEKIAK